MPMRTDSHQEFWQFASDGWTPPMFTYIVACEGSNLLKIGRTKTPDSRLKMMQTGCPNELSYIWCWPDNIEKGLHIYFDHRRVRGEWFDISIDDAIYAAAWMSKEKVRWENMVTGQVQEDDWVRRVELNHYAEKYMWEVLV